MSKKYTIIITAILLFSFMLQACSETPTTSESTPAIPTDITNILKFPLLVEPYTFNPCAIMEQDSSVIIQNVFSRLVKTNAKGEIIPDLASDWKFSSDDLSLTITLRNDVTWHDGSRFTASDVKYTLDTIKSSHGVLWESLEAISMVEATSDFEIVLHFSSPDPFILNTLANESASILPSHLYSGNDWLACDAVYAPIGTGAYMYTARAQGELITLEAYEDYFEGEAKIELLQFFVYSSPDEARLAFELGDIDVLNTPMSLSSVAKYVASGDYDVVAVNDASRIYLTFNHDNPVFTHTLRRAISYAIDQEDILMRAMLGIGAVSDGFISPMFEDTYTELANLPDTDIDRANQLMQLNREEQTPEGEEPNDEEILRMTLKVYDAEPYPEIATVIKEQLIEIGIDVTVITMDYGEWQENVFVNSDFELTLVGGSQGPYPEMIIHRLATDGALNFMGYSNVEIDNLLYRAYVEPDVDERETIMKDMQFRALEDLPIIPIAEWYTIIAMTTDISSVPANSEDVGINEWHMATIDNLQ